MTRVHIVDADNRHLYGAIVDQSFRTRHEVLIEEHNWKIPSRPDRRQIDAWDDDEAVYVVALEDETVIAGIRLYPTTRPTVLTEAFEHLCMRKVPASSTVVEAARYFVVKGRRDLRTDCVLITAMQEHCLRRGIDTVIAVVGTARLPAWHSAGLVTRPLGLPAPIDGQECLAVEIAVRVETLSRAREIADLGEPCTLASFPSGRRAGNCRFHA